jgi:hypothetical protein
MNRIGFVAAFLIATAAAQAQSMVEYSLGVSRAAAGGAGVRRVGKAAASTLEKAGEVQAGAVLSAPSSSTVVAPAQPGNPAKAVKFTAPEPGQIKAGMEREELIRKCGEPAMKISGAGSDETWWYGSDPNAVTVKLRAGKVVDVTPSPDARTAKKDETAATPNQSNTSVVVLR